MSLCCCRVATTKSWLVSPFQIGSTTGAGWVFAAAASPGTAGLFSSEDRPVPAVGIERIFFTSSIIFSVLTEKEEALLEELAALAPEPTAEASWLLMLGAVMAT